MIQTDPTHHDNRLAPPDQPRFRPQTAAEHRHPKNRSQRALPSTRIDSTPLTTGEKHS